MKTITLDYYGMTGQGRTVTEAKQDAGRKITEALSGDYTPRVYSFGGNTWAVWRTPRGIVSGRVLPDGKFGGTCLHGRDTFEEACYTTRFHLAQLGCDITSDEIPSILPGDEKSIREFSWWLGFQRAYRHAKAGGKNDMDSHYFAGENARNFAPTLRPAHCTTPDGRYGQGWTAGEALENASKP